jgi:hypothetical protein
MNVVIGCCSGCCDLEQFSVWLKQKFANLTLKLESEEKFRLTGAEHRKVRNQRW